MEKRVSKRIPKKLQVKFWSGGINYTGITTNVSENGMFIGTRMGFSRGALLDIKITLPTEDVLRIPVRVKRTIKVDSYQGYNIYKNGIGGIGVQLASRHPRYEKFIRNLKTPY